MLLFPTPPFPTCNANSNSTLKLALKTNWSTYYDNFYGNLQLFFSHYHFWGFWSINITFFCLESGSYRGMSSVSNTMFTGMLNLKTTKKMLQKKEAENQLVSCNFKVFVQIDRVDHKKRDYKVAAKKLAAHKSNYATHVTLISGWWGTNLSGFTFCRFKYSIPLQVSHISFRLLDCAFFAFLMLPTSNVSERSIKIERKTWNYHPLHKLMAPSSITDYRVEKMRKWAIFASSEQDVINVKQRKSFNEKMYH